MPVIKTQDQDLLVVYTVVTYIRNVFKHYYKMKQAFSTHAISSIILLYYNICIFMHYYINKR